MDGDKVLFTQTDQSLIILDATTGSILRTTKPMVDFTDKFPLSLPEVCLWAPINDALLGMDRSGGAWVVAKRESGEIEFAPRPIWEDVLFYQKRVFYVACNTSVIHGGDDSWRLAYYDTETKVERVLAESKERIVFDIVGNDLVALFLPLKQNQSLSLACFNLLTEEQRWNAELHSEAQGWMACEKEKIYVCEESGDSRTPSTRVRSFDYSGTELPVRDGEVNMVTGPRGRYFNGVEYALGHPESKTPVGSFDDCYNAAKRLDIDPDNIIAGRIFDDGGVVAVQRNGPKSDLVQCTFDLLFKGRDGGWSRRINCLDDLRQLFPAGTPVNNRTVNFFLSGNEDYITYSTSTGKVECLDRETGTPLWLYIHSRFPYFNWETVDADDPWFSSVGRGKLFGTTGWAAKSAGIVLDALVYPGSHDFYTDVRRIYDLDMSPAWLRAASASGGAVQSVPRVIVDPNPQTVVSHWTGVAAFFVWGTPFVTVVLALLVLVFKRRRGLVRRVACLVAGMTANMLVIYCFGLYSAAGLYLLLAAVVIDCIAIGWILVRCERYGYRRLSGECRESPLRAQGA